MNKAINPFEAAAIAKAERHAATQPLQLTQAETIESPNWDARGANQGWIDPFDYEENADLKAPFERMRDQIDHVFKSKGIVASKPECL